MLGPRADQSLHTDYRLFWVRSQEGSPKTRANRYCTGVYDTLSDVLIYWRDYKQNWVYEGIGERAWYWHSNAKLVGDLLPGDRVWLVASGRNLRREPQQAAFVVAVWQVRAVVLNPDVDRAYPAHEYRFRIVGDETASIRLDEPVLIDHLVRPQGHDKATGIGRFLQGTRRLKSDMVRLLRAAAGPQMAGHYLTGK